MVSFYLQHYLSFGTSQIQTRIVSAVFNIIFQLDIYVYYLPGLHFFHVNNIHL